jgi:uncharacterized protein (TIGR02680 family)
MSDELFSENSGNGAPHVALPRPNHERWQPLRSGVLNIFKYDAEEFWFEDGRLLLRGNNGAGKSRILALQLPFLLDGEMASHRVEPDGDPAKRMEWNLLMNRHEQRLGYTWIEFGRRDAEGREHFLTLGCGMHARKGTGIPPNARWFFITRRRIGETLQLMSESRVPLNRERLEAALGSEGTIYRSARDYRAAVDDALFALGARYGPLIELLLQLRKPQIMRDFKADDLSRLLSEALQPLSPTLIDNVSVSFRSLESDRQQLTDLNEASRSVSTFLQSYQHYVRVAVRRRAAEVRATHSRYETAQREIKRLADEREENGRALDAAEVEEKRVAKDLVAARSSERTLLDSPEMKSAEDLRRADESKRERSKQAEAAGGIAAQNQEAWARMSREREEAEAAAANVATLASACQTALQEVWESAALHPPVPDGKDKLDAAVKDRVREIALLREKNGALAKAIDRREKEETRFEQRRGDVARCEEAETVARNTCEAELTALVTLIYEWENGLKVLALPVTEDEDWRMLLEGWMEATDTPSPLARRIEAASQSATRLLADERSRCERDVAERTAERQTLQTEIASLRDGRQPEPPAPHTRAAEIRVDRPGAPLWKLCGFRDEIPAANRAGFEAGLEASGLLDAWVTPGGALIDPATQDVFFSAARGQADAGLNRVLRAEGALAEIVPGLLGCIGSAENEGETWVSPDGRWRHGLLRGAWQKPTAEYLGHTAREEARLRRIAELETAVAALDEVIQALERERQRIDERSTQLAAERDRAPGTALLQRAALSLENAGTASAEARARLEEVDQSLARAREVESTARAARDRDADDLGLSAWKEPDALNKLEALLGEVREKAAALWPALEALRSAQTALEKALAREEGAQNFLSAAMARAHEAQQLATEAEASYAALYEMVGASADQVLQRLNEVREDLRRLGHEEELARKKVGDLRVKIAVIAEKEKSAETDREQHENARTEAVRRLQLFAEKKLLEEAGEGLQPERTELAANPAVELSRRIEQALAEVSSDEDSWKRAQSGIQQQFSELNDQLGMRGYHPQAEVVDEGVFAITCAFHGQAHTMTALRQSLTDEMASREQMLGAREREVIENHLIGEVATELQTLIRAGEDWVRIANDELDRQPASSGIKLRFTWEVDAEAADDLETARRQLLKMTAAWSPAERDSIGRFLHGRINAERAADESAPWQEHLRRALDYRAWHRFGILRFQDGQWKKLTKQTYGTGSGGEKALTLTLPQFAAAAAHYRSAAPHAPRLILLDEVFIGIDAPTRARLMALLHSFDLDFVMTSEREWGCYRTLPALSICQLASRADSPAVHVTRWLWNGRDRLPHPNGSTV